MEKQDKLLAQPLSFKPSGSRASNRLMKAAMTERMSSFDLQDPSQHGIPSEELINLYETWGKGGYGMVITGNVFVNHVDIESPGNATVPQGASHAGPRFEAYCNLARRTKQGDILFIAQVNHAGRQASAFVQPDPVSASAIQLLKNDIGQTFAPPHAASIAEIQQIIADFAYAASYLEACGFDGVQVHAAHGYLLAQFLSPTTNKRTDQYGGSLESRARFVIEVARAVRASTKPGFVMGVKVNSVEFQADGFTPEDAGVLCQLLEREGFDFVELSGGTYEELSFHHRRESTRAREAFFAEFAEMIAPRCEDMKVYVTGGLRSAEGMRKAVQVVDGVGLGRPTTQEPVLARGLLEGSIERVRDQGFDGDNFGVGLMVSLCQMRQIGEGKAPFDAGDQGNVTRFLKQLEEFIARNDEARGRRRWWPMEVKGLSPIGVTKKSTQASPPIDISMMGDEKSTPRANANEATESVLTLLRPMKDEKDKGNYNTVKGSAEAFPQIFKVLTENLENVEIDDAAPEGKAFKNDCKLICNMLKNCTSEEDKAIGVERITVMQEGLCQLLEKRANVTNEEWNAWRFTLNKMK